MENDFYSQNMDTDQIIKKRGERTKLKDPNT